MRALITRPRAEAEALAVLLGERGIEAVIEPLIEIADGTMALPELDGVQAILCTSANGVRAMARASVERRLPVFAVGDATAARARAEGFRHVESAGGDVEDLAYLVGRRLKPQDGKLLHIAGSTIAGDLAAALGAEGFTVERAVLYDASPAVALTSATVRAIGDGAFDFAVFFSPRTAAIFARLAEEAGVLAGLRLTVAVSISAAADAMVADLPFRHRIIAEKPTQAALVACIDRLVGQPA
ncbi:MAG TPA: uroporphyrinogen-III synthase [Stellaceae bacterium]|nr:uroporphyrinogen-III synthase [Stellaceae bacterium]